MAGREGDILEIFTSRRRRGRPASIDRETLIRVALKRGPDRLNLREIAEELDVPRTTIYNHVRSPMELGSLVLAALLEPISWTIPQGDWRERLEFFARQERATLLIGGDWLRFFDNAQIRHESTSHAEDLIASLVDCGFPNEEAGHALSLVHGIVLESIRFGRHELRADAVAHRHLESKAWPLLAATAQAVDKTWAEDQFEYALSRVIAGIAALGGGA